MAQVNHLSTQIDPTLTQAVEEVLQTWGMTSEQVLTAFYQYIIQNRRLPFELTLSGIQNGSTNGYSEKDIYIRF